MSRSLREIYGALFLDCPAGISLLSENVLRAADVVIVPLLPAPLSLRMLEQLLEFVQREGWHDLLLLPFFSMVDRRRALHRELIASARDKFPLLLATEVPYWSQIERMSVRARAAAGIRAAQPRGPGVHDAVGGDRRAAAGARPRAVGRLRRGLCSPAMPGEAALMSRRCPRPRALTGRHKRTTFGALFLPSAFRDGHRRGPHSAIIGSGDRKATAAGDRPRRHKQHIRMRETPRAWCP